MTVIGLPITGRDSPSRNGQTPLNRNPEVLRAVARERDNRLGVYGSTVQPGVVTVSDPVELEA